MRNIKNAGKLYAFVGFTFAVCLALTSCSQQKNDPAMGDKNAQALHCANQLNMFVGGKKAWAEQNNKTADDVPTMDDIKPFIRCGTNCPSGGTYTLGKVGDLPTCSIPEHQAAFTKMLQEQSAAPTQ